MLILEIYLKISKSLKQSKGFTLIELLVAVFMSGIVMVALGAGLVSLLNSTSRSETKANLKNQLNRAIDYINEDIKRARFAEITTTNTTNDTLTLTYFENTNDNTSNTIEYYMDVASNPWLGPNIIRRRLTVGGQPPGEWQVLVDSISDNVAGSSNLNEDFPTCSGSTTLNAAGFRACVEIGTSSQNVNLYRVGIALFGEVSDRETLGVDIKTIAQSVSPALDPPTLDVPDDDPTPDVSWSSVNGATGYEIYRCTYTDGDPICDPQIGQTITIDGTDYSSLFYSGSLNAFPETVNATVGDRWCYAGRSTDGVNFSELSSPAECGGVSTGGAPTAITNLDATDLVLPVVTWSEVTDAEDYYLYRCSTSTATCTPDSSGTAIAGPISTGSTLEFTETSDPPSGQKWCYLATATNAIGPSQDSNVDCGLVNSNSAPNAPTISLDSTNTNIINWTDQTANGATSYSLYQCEANAGNTCNPTTVFTGFPQFALTATQNVSATVGRRWCYAVEAINTTPSPQQTSPLSNIVCGDVALAAPTFTNTPFSGTQPTVNWSSVANATSYDLYRCPTEDTSSPCDPLTGSKVNPANDASQTYSESNSPDDGEAFCYGVLAKNTGGSSVLSSTACGEIKVATCLVPNVIGASTASETQRNDIIAQITGAGFSSPAINPVTNGAIQVQSINPSANSVVDCSTPVSVTWREGSGVSAPSPAPILAAVSPSGFNNNASVTVVWADPSGVATSYELNKCYVNNGTCNPITSGSVVANITFTFRTDVGVALNGNKNACYAVRSKNEAGYSGYSSVTCAK